MRLRRVGIALILLIAASTASRPAWGKTGIVTTREGYTYEGDIIEHESSVEVIIRGVRTRIPNRDIETVRYVENTEAEFRDRKSKLLAGDVDGRLKLARWAFDAREYKLAREALDEAQSLDPNNREIADFQDIVFRQMRMERDRAKQSPSPTTQTTSSPRRGPRLLNDEQINAIRQAEWTASDHAVRARLNNLVGRRYVEFNRSRPEDFARMSPADQAFEIVRRGTPEMRKDVRILNDPAALAEYRRVVQPRVLAGCGTTNCHGGTRSGDFHLIGPADTDAATYTNFFVLQSFTTEVAGRKRFMLDRSLPEQSLLLQYLLPHDQADIDHPRMQGLRSVAKGKEDPIYRGILRWLTDSLSPVQPEYGFEFSPIKAKEHAGGSSGSTTQPARELTDD